MRDSWQSRMIELREHERGQIRGGAAGPVPPEPRLTGWWAAELTIGFDTIGLYPAS